MTKHTPPILVALQRDRSRPLLRQVYDGVRQAILDRRVLPGSRLPPTRALAEDLGVSRTTVVLAYERLASEGYLEGRGSAGSFVAPVRLTCHLPPPAPPAPRGDRPIARALPAGTDGLARIRPAPTPFRLGEPAIDRFPMRLWARLYGRRARRGGGALLGYGSHGGYAPLRAAIAAYVRAARGVNASEHQVILTRGAQQAIDLLGRLLLVPGDAVWLEDPGYLSARALFQLAGARLIGVPVDAEGLDVAAGERLEPQARLAYVSPSHHFPLGRTMSLSRRLALLAWARRVDGWIVEDDFDSEFRYAPATIPSLQGLDSGQRVIYLGTFSKTVFPALRLGYLIVPEHLIEAFHRAQTLLDHLAPSLEQATLTEFLEEGHFTRHVRRMRTEYGLRQEALLEAMRQEVPEELEAERADTGMHLIGWLRARSLHDRRVSQMAWSAGVEAAPLSPYTLITPQPPALLLGFAAIRPDQMAPALRVLRGAIGRVPR